ncbi:conserved Plasmodium protein, unknown function [Plasmodium yoelii]|uniref:Uncharacterized protein n=3 Tax=Plasmodium yoelii TaxID=5861 RepID=A0AAF0B552_PLAYO|nr:conserved Plasmodium protein, unknown function [Plasmodium yoelii]WBY60013.1 hypothetical protein Py17XNL_001303184 [Plasmodium yoelii yoelii]CDU19946.1 conserved Plasmodium protein, unknown function [Plasmodium yoelii]VTZ80704.1 conserved Plasmodium protein, unknown function [Plasmodium yoelii]|eukprot:XP_022813607.1 conserved Plasmodium protein, unknown function [Plasmodium yoelii]
MMRNYSKYDDKRNETDMDWDYIIKKDDSESHVLSNEYENIYDSSSSDEDENVHNKSKTDLTEYYLYNEINNHKYNNNIYDFYLNKFNNNFKEENKRNESHNSVYKKNSSFIKNKGSNKGKIDSLKKLDNSDNEFDKNQIKKNHSLEKKYNSHSVYNSKSKQSIFKNKGIRNTEIVNAEHNKDIYDLPSELVSNNYTNKEDINTIPKDYNINNKKYSEHTDTKNGVNIYLNTLINKCDYTISCYMYKKTSATHIYRKRIIVLKKKFLIINKFKQNINNIYKVVNRDIYDISHARISDIYKSSNNIYKFTIYAKRICIDNISSNSDNSNFFSLKKKNAKRKSKDYYKISNDGFHFNNEQIRLANHNLNLITEFINLMKIISIYGSIKKYMKILFFKSTQNGFLKNYGLYYSSPMYFKFLKKYYNSMMHNVYNYIYINILKIKNIEQIKYSYIYAIIDVNDFLYYYKYEYNKDMFIPLFSDKHNKIVFHFYTDLDIYLGYFILYSYEIEKHIYFDLYLNNGKRSTELYNSHMSSGAYRNCQKNINNNNIYKNSYNDSFYNSTSSNTTDNLGFSIDNNKADSKLLNEDSLLNQKNIIFDKNYFFVKKLTNDQKKNAPRNSKYVYDSTDDNFYVHIFIYKSKNRFEYLLPQENSANMLGDNENLSMPNNNLNNNYQLISLFLNNVKRTMQIKNRVNKFLDKLNDIFEFKSFPVSIISLIYIFLCSYFKNYIHIILLLTIIFLISINNEKNYDTYRYLLFQYPILYLFFPHNLLCKISNKSNLYHLHTFVHMFILNKFPIFFQYLYKNYRCKCLYFFAYTPTYFGKYYNSYFISNEDNDGINKNRISLDRMIKRKYYGKKCVYKHSNKKYNSPDKIEYLESHTIRKKETYENSRQRIFSTLVKGSNHIDYKNNSNSNYITNYSELRGIKENNIDNHDRRYYSISNEVDQTRHPNRRDNNDNVNGSTEHSKLLFDRCAKNDQYNNNQKYDILNSSSNKHMNDNQIINISRDKHVKAEDIDKEKGENIKCKKEEKVNDNILNNLRKYLKDKKNKIINNTKKKSGNNLENEKYTNDMTYLKNNYNYLEGSNTNMNTSSKYNTKFYNKMLRNRKIHNLISNNKNQLMEYYDLREYNNKNLSNKHTDNYLNNISENLYSNNIKDKLYHQECPFDEYIKNRKNNILKENVNQGNFIPSNISETCNTLNVKDQESYIHRNTFLVSKHDDYKEDTVSYNSDEKYYNNNDTYDSSYNCDLQKSSNSFNVNDVMLADLEVKIMNNMRNNYYQPNNENNTKEQNDDKYALHELSRKNNTNNNFYFEINNEKYSMDFLVYEKSCFQYCKPCKSSIKSSNINYIGQTYKERKNGRFSSNEILCNLESSHNEYNINRNERISTNTKNRHSNYNYDNKDNVNFLFGDKHINQKNKIKNKDGLDKKKNIKFSDYYINISTNDSLYNIVEYFPKYFYNTIKIICINIILIFIYVHCLLIITVHGGLNNDFPLYVYFLNKMKKKEKKTVKQKEKSNNSVNIKEENAKINTNKKSEEKNYTSNFLFKPKRIFKRWKQQKKHIKIDLNQNLLKSSNDAKDVKALENNVDPLNSNQKIHETEQILCNESSEIGKHKKNNEKNMNTNETNEYNNDETKTTKSSLDIKINTSQQNVSDIKIGTIYNPSPNLEKNKQTDAYTLFDNNDKYYIIYHSPENIYSNNNSYNNSNYDDKSNNTLDNALNDKIRNPQDNNNKNGGNDGNKNTNNSNIINQRNNADITLNIYDSNNKKINCEKIMGNSSKILKKNGLFHEKFHLKDSHKSGMNNEGEKNVDLLNYKIKSPQNQKENTLNDLSNDSYIDNGDEHDVKDKLHDTTETLNDNPNDLNNGNDDNRENKNKIMNIFGKLKDIKEEKITKIKNIYKSEIQKRKNEKISGIKSGFDIIKNKINRKIAKNNFNNDSSFYKNEKKKNSQSNIEDEESYNTLNDNCLDNLSSNLYSDNEFLQTNNYKEFAYKEKENKCNDNIEHKKLIIKNNNPDDKKTLINNTSNYMNKKYKVQNRTDIEGILDRDLHFDNNKNSRNNRLRNITNNIHRLIIYGNDKNKFDYKNKHNITLSKMRSISLNIKKNSIEKKVMHLEENIMNRGPINKNCEISMKISRDIIHRTNNITKEYSKNKIKNKKSVDYIKKISSINYNSNVDGVENDTFSLTYSKELLGLKVKGHRNHSHFSYKCKHLYAINANISYKILKGLQKDNYGLKNIHEKGHFSEYDMAAISKNGGKKNLDYINNMQNYLKNVNVEDIKMKYSDDLNFLKNDKNIQYNSMLYKSISMEKSDDENKNQANDKLNDIEYKMNLLKKKGNNLLDNMKKQFKKFKNKNNYLKDKIKQKLLSKQPMLSYDIYKDEKDKIASYDVNVSNINNTKNEKSERTVKNSQNFKSVFQKNHESFHNFLEQSLYSNNIFKNKISTDLKNEFQTLDDYFKNIKNKFKLLSNSNIAYEMVSNITRNEQRKIYINKLYKRNLSNLELIHNNNWNNLNSRELLKGFTQRNKLFYQNWKLKYLSSTINALNLSTIENNIEYLNSLKNFYNYRSLSYYEDLNGNNKFIKGNNIKKKNREYHFFTKKINNFNKFLLNKRNYYNSIEKSSIFHKLLYGVLIFIINYFLIFTILYVYIHDIYNLFKFSKYMYLKAKKYDKKKNKDFNSIVKIIYQKNIFSSNANSLYTNRHKNIYMKKNIFAQIFVQNKKENIKMNQKYDQEYSEEEGEFSSDNGHVKKNEFKNNFLPNRYYEENKDKKNILTVYKNAKTNLKIFMHKHMILNLYLEKFLNLFNHKNFNLTKVVISLLVYISILLLPIKFHHLIILKLLHMYYKGYLRRYYKNVIINSILENIRNAKINLKLYKPICSLNDDECCMLIEEINKGCNISLNISQFKDIYDEYDLANVIIQNLKEFVESKKIISHEWNINLLNHSPHDNISTINPR